FSQETWPILDFRRDGSRVSWGRPERAVSSQEVECARRAPAANGRFLAIISVAGLLAHAARIVPRLGPGHVAGQPPASSLFSPAPRRLRLLCSPVVSLRFDLCLAGGNAAFVPLRLVCGPGRQLRPVVPLAWLWPWRARSPPTLACSAGPHCPGQRNHQSAT